MHLLQCMQAGVLVKIGSSVYIEGAVLIWNDGAWLVCRRQSGVEMLHVCCVSGCVVQAG